jgi:hypothetical protein
MALRYPHEMITLVRSKTAMAAFAIGAGLVALGYFLAGLSYALLSYSGSGASSGLYRGDLWVSFVGWAVIAAGIAAVGWSAFLGQHWVELGEVGAAAVATLLIAVGVLVLAAGSAGALAGGAGDVVEAVGIGLWALLLGYRAGRSSVAEQKAVAGTQRQAAIWGVAAVAVLALAVGTGLSGSQSDSRTPQIVAYVFLAVGFGALVTCLSIARSRGVLDIPGFPSVAGGLWLLALFSLLSAIAIGVVLGPNGTLTGARVGMSIPQFIAAAGAGLLGLAALQRMTALARVASPVDPGPIV